jgi:hypothetical protein
VGHLQGEGNAFHDFHYIIKKREIEAEHAKIRSQRESIKNFIKVVYLHKVSKAVLNKIGLIKEEIRQRRIMLKSAKLMERCLMKRIK